MINREKLIDALDTLGREMRAFGAGSLTSDRASAYEWAVAQAGAENPWFTEFFVARAMSAIGQSLTRARLESWLARYHYPASAMEMPLTIGVVMAGNIPMVGFHDLLSVLCAGHRFQGKLSSDDNILLPLVASRLTEFYPSLGDHIAFTEDRLSGFDAVIATGSNNTSRYFDYYFGRYPHIIRKNRNGTAVLSGHESQVELERLGEDVFLYFGLGCRSVSKLFVPEGYDFGPMMEAFTKFGEMVDLNKYKNNYDYYRSIFLINGTEHVDNGFLLVTGDRRFASPPSVLYYETYSGIGEVNARLVEEKENIQCVVSSSGEVTGALPLGTAQLPELWEYADSVDTLAFLLDLSAGSTA